MKEFGESVDHVYRDMKEAGLPEPVYRQSKFMLYVTLKNKNWGKEHVSWMVTIHDEKNLLEFCTVPRSRKEMMEYMDLLNRQYF